MRRHLIPLLTVAILVASSATAPAQTPTLPVHCVVNKDGMVRPAAGYRWVAATAGDFRVQWVPGTLHPDYKNIFAGSKEGDWFPVPGFKWTTNAKDDLRVEWAPGKVHSALYPNTIAGDREGKWRPAAGYRWVSTSDGDLRTEQIVAASTGPSEEQVKRALVKIIGATVAHAIASQDGDGSIGDAIVREIARSARDELIKRTLEDLFPNMPSQDRLTASNLICLALDKQLTIQNLSEREAKDAILAKLRHQNPDMANAAEVADFVYRVMEAQSR